MVYFAINPDPMHDALAVFGRSEGMIVDKTELRKEKRSLMMQFHPDKCSQEVEEVQKCTDKAAQIASAFDLITEEYAFVKPS